MFLKKPIYSPSTYNGSNGHLNFVSPHQVLAELKKTNFTLLNQSIQFDEDGDPKYGSYALVFWNNSGDAEEIGFFDFFPSYKFSINDSIIQWYAKGEVSVQYSNDFNSLCSIWW